MKMAVLERDFQDAVHVMDGQRLLPTWKFKMLHFRDACRTKYGLKAFLFQADQLVSIFSTHGMLTGGCGIEHSTCNGGFGRNIPLDLRVEHNNNFVNDMIRNQGANVSFQSAKQVSRASMGLESVLTNLENILAIADESNKHAAVDRKKDVLLTAKGGGGNARKQTRSRAHKSFALMKYDVLHQLNP